jgi:hypothetical protein
VDRQIDLLAKESEPLSDGEFLKYPEELFLTLHRREYLKCPFLKNVSNTWRKRFFRKKNCFNTQFVSSNNDVTTWLNSGTKQKNWKVFV